MKKDNRKFRKKLGEKWKKPIKKQEKKPRYRELLFSVPQTLTSLRLWEEKASKMGRESCHDSWKENDGIGDRGWDEDFNRNIEDAMKNIINENNDEKPRFWEGGFVEKRCNRRLTNTYSPKLSKALTLINKTKIKSELVRFNFA